MYARRGSDFQTCQPAVVIIREFVKQRMLDSRARCAICYRALAVLLTMQASRLTIDERSAINLQAPEIIRVALTVEGHAR